MRDVINDSLSFPFRFISKWSFFECCLSASWMPFQMILLMDMLECKYIHLMFFSRIEIPESTFYQWWEYESLWNYCVIRWYESWMIDKSTTKKLKVGRCISKYHDIFDRKMTYTSTRNTITNCVTLNFQLNSKFVAECGNFLHP